MKASVGISRPRNGKPHLTIALSHSTHRKLVGQFGECAFKLKRLGPDRAKFLAVVPGESGSHVISPKGGSGELPCRLQVGVEVGTPDFAQDGGNPQELVLEEDGFTIHFPAPGNRQRARRHNRVSKEQTAPEPEEEYELFLTPQGTFHVTPQSSKMLHRVLRQFKVTSLTPPNSNTSSTPTNASPPSRRPRQPAGQRPANCRTS